MFEIKHLRVIVIFIIHTAKLGVSVKHSFFGFNPVVFYEFTGYAEPDAVFERTYFGFSFYKRYDIITSNRRRYAAEMLTHLKTLVFV